MTTQHKPTIGNVTLHVQVTGLTEENHMRAAELLMDDFVRLLDQAGIPAMEVIVTSSRDGARFIGSVEV